MVAHRLRRCGLVSRSPLDGGNLKRDLYETLEVLENASANVINQAAQEQLSAAKSAANLSEAQRKVRLEAIREAHRILADTRLRAEYDASLRAMRETDAGGRRFAGIKISTLVALAVGVVLVGGAVSYTSNVREQKRALAELARIEAEQEEIRKRDQALAREAAEQNAKRLRLAEAEREREQAERERVEIEREMANQKFVADREAVKATRARDNSRAIEVWREHVKEAQQSYRSEQERRQAQAEVERQKRFLLESEREEERARLLRAREVEQQRYRQEAAEWQRRR